MGNSVSEPSTSQDLLVGTSVSEMYNVHRPSRQLPRYAIPLDSCWEIYDDDDTHDLYSAARTMSQTPGSEMFNMAMLDAFRTAQSVRNRLDSKQYRRFINVWTEWTLFHVCHHFGNGYNSHHLMKNISTYAQRETDDLALAWRFFTLNDTISGLSSVMAMVAQNCFQPVLQLLLQHGMLEKERKPHQVINIILFKPLPHRIENLMKEPLRKKRIECITLCLRVLTHVNITSIKFQIRAGLTPLITDWRDYIPTSRYKVPCELTHLCRMAIRSRLLTRGLLPDGIFELPLSLTLKKYLNLEA